VEPQQRGRYCAGPDSRRATKLPCPAAVQYFSLLQTFQITSRVHPVSLLNSLEGCYLPWGYTEWKTEPIPHHRILPRSRMHGDIPPSHQIISRHGDQAHRQLSNVIKQNTSMYRVTSTLNGFPGSWSLQLDCSHSLKTHKNNQ
jgi:hypothetical protein